MPVVFLLSFFLAPASENRQALPPVGRASQQLRPGEEGLLLQDPPAERASRGEQEPCTLNGRRVTLFNTSTKPNPNPAKKASSYRRGCPRWNRYETELTEPQGTRGPLTLNTQPQL